MYRVNVMLNGEVSRRVFFDESPTERQLREIPLDKGQWLDVERMPPDVEEYKREREVECEFS